MIKHDKKTTSNLSKNHKLTYSDDVKLERQYLTENIYFKVSLSPIDKDNNQILCKYTYRYKNQDISKIYKELFLLMTEYKQQTNIYFKIMDILLKDFTINLCNV